MELHIVKFGFTLLLGVLFALLSSSQPLVYLGYLLIVVSIFFIIAAFMTKESRRY